MKIYKLTDENMRTYGECQWEIGVTRTVPGTGALCKAGWLHAYTDPLVAVLMNPIHANFQAPRMFEAEGDVGIEEHGLKVGCTSITLIREIELPTVTAEHRVRFGILCALKVCGDLTFQTWAHRWLTGEDRTLEAAWAMKDSAAAARARVRASRTSWPAESAVIAQADAPVWAAGTAITTEEQRRALRAAQTAKMAARAGAWAAQAATRATRATLSRARAAAARARAWEVELAAWAAETAETAEASWVTAAAKAASRAAAATQASVQAAEAETEAAAARAVVFDVAALAREAVNA